MEKIKVYIVDDEQHAIESLSKAINTFFNDIEIVGSAQTIAVAYNEISALNPDLVFLDIEMGDESGFQLLQMFDKVNFQVAFVTAHVEFALQAIKFSALDYIVKPPGITDLKQLFEKIRTQEFPKTNEQVKHMFGNFLTKNKAEHKITLPVTDGFEFVQISELLYLRAEGSYTTFSLKNGSEIISSRNLKYFEGILNGYGFYRIHNSTLINLKYIKKVSKSLGGHVVMEDDSEWGIARSRKDDFMKLIALK